MVLWFAINISEMLEEACLSFRLNFLVNSALASLINLVSDDYKQAVRDIDTNNTDISLTIIVPMHKIYAIYIYNSIVDLFISYKMIYL